ncbi:hypothetical protein NLJ89_g703 [Agrocybe chaxingu]|uniref:Uncharacterized protein n=1 Tax=Agrocybe chaxingu TaxID=84603 RepID=A0A9W8TEN3_9AGAR|nr:hypothetical protein NLJ89_g703 [Agrocybe chaxingu]
MHFSDLPDKVIDNIVASVLVDYMDDAIASPPKPAWLVPYSSISKTYVRRNLLTRRARLGLGPLIIPVGSDKTEWSGVTSKQFYKIVLMGVQLFGDDLDAAPLLPRQLLECCLKPRRRNEVMDDEDDESNSGSEDDVKMDFELDGRSETYDEDSGSETPNTQGRDAGDVQNPYIDFDDMSDGSSSEEETDDEDEDSDEDSDQDLSYEETLEEWERYEKLDRLPKDQILPLLAAHKRIRQATLKVLKETLGIETGALGNQRLYEAAVTVLRNIRRIYRRAHTPGLAAGSLLMSHDPVTPFIDAYLGLSMANYLISSADILVNNGRLSKVEKTMQGIRYIHFGIPNPILRPHIAQRAHIAYMRWRRWKRLTLQAARILAIGCALVEVQDPKRPKWVLNSEYAAAFEGAIHGLELFEEKYMGKESFDVLPPALIEHSKIMTALEQVDGFRILNVVRENEAVLNSVRKGSTLFKIWDRRSRAKTSFYVALESAPRKFWLEGEEVMESAVV